MDATNGNFLNWQAGKSVSEINRFLLNNELMSDIQFTFDDQGEDILYAHSWKLAERSPQFYQQFNGNYGVKKFIQIREYQPHLFQDFLEFIYTDTCTIDEENIASLLDLATKFSISLLERNCIVWVEQNLSNDTVCQLLNYSVAYQIKSLETKLLNHIAHNFRHVITSLQFITLSKDALAAVLGLDKIFPCSEVDIIENVVRWAATQELKTELNQRELLGDAVKLIRFAAMTFEEFASCMSHASNIMTQDELNSVFASISEQKKNTSGFVDRKRQFLYGDLPVQSLENLYKKKLDLCIERGQPSGLTSFFVTKKIILIGISIESSAIDQQCMIRISAENDPNNLLIYEEIKTNKNTLKNFDFSGPCLIEPNKSYNIQIDYENFTEKFNCNNYVVPPIKINEEGGVVITFSEISKLFRNFSFKLL